MTAFQPKLAGFPEVLPSFENFMAGENEAVLSLLKAWLENPESAVFFLYGESGAGKTHLLKAANVFYCDLAQNPNLENLPNVETTKILALDNFQKINAIGQQNFFNAFNQKTQYFLVAANQPPLHLHLREDVKNRLGTGLIYRLKPLAELQKSAALLKWAKDEGVHLSDSVLHYILTHCARDMKSLQTLLKKADDFCFAQKRQLTVPLIKQLLENPDELSTF